MAGLLDATADVVPRDGPESPVPADAPDSPVRSRGRVTWGPGFVAFDRLSADEVTRVSAAFRRLQARRRRTGTRECDEAEPPGSASSHSGLGPVAYTWGSTARVRRRRSRVIRVAPMSRVRADAAAPGYLRDLPAATPASLLTRSPATAAATAATGSAAATTATATATAREHRQGRSGSQDQGQQGRAPDPRPTNIST